MNDATGRRWFDIDIQSDFANCDSVIHQVIWIQLFCHFMTGRQKEKNDKIIFILKYT